MTQSFWLKTEDNVELYVRYWDDLLGEPKGVVQIAHGMVEHIGRYDAYAAYLNEQGFIVYGNDHRGHGRTGDKQGLLGFFADDDGFQLLVDDMVLLTNYIQKNHPNLPLFLFGHSMGSFATRIYLQTYSDLPTGVILSGTGSFPMVTSIVGRELAASLPPKKESKLLHGFNFYGYNEEIPQRLTEFDWLTRDEAVVKDYIQDPYSGYIPTARFFYDLLSGILVMQDQKKNKQIKKALPILFISGSKDPVGANGKGVFKAAQDYTTIGLENISVMLFSDARHELLHEINKQEVYQVLDSWLKRQVSTRDH